MTSVWRLNFLLLILLVLAACAAPISSAAAPAPTFTTTAVSTDRAELAAGRYQLLMFYSPLWVTCRELAPVVNGLMKNYTDRVRFVRLNIHDKATFDLQSQLGFSTTPEFYLIDPQGRVEHKWDESVDLQELEQTVKALPLARWQPVD
jgi:thiol-disulfide isomerase/thioredoxin